MVAAPATGAVHFGAHDAGHGLLGAALRDVAGAQGMVTPDVELTS